MLMRIRFPSQGEFLPSIQLKLLPVISNVYIYYITFERHEVTQDCDAKGYMKQEPCIWQLLNK